MRVNKILRNDQVVRHEDEEAPPRIADRNVSGCRDATFCGCETLQSARQPQLARNDEVASLQPLSTTRLVPLRSQSLMTQRSKRFFQRSPVVGCYYELTKISSLFAEERVARHIRSRSALNDFLINPLIAPHHALERELSRAAPTTSPNACARSGFRECTNRIGQPRLSAVHEHPTSPWGATSECRGRMATTGLASSSLKQRESKDSARLGNTTMRRANQSDTSSRLPRNRTAFCSPLARTSASNSPRCGHPGKEEDDRTDSRRDLRNCIEQVPMPFPHEASEHQHTCSCERSNSWRSLSTPLGSGSRNGPSRYIRR